jgi:hypothetical protein
MTRSVNITQTIITTLLKLSRLCRLLLVRMDVYIVTLSDFYSYRFIGKLTAFFAASGVQSAQSNLGATYFHFRRAVVLNHLKSKCGLLLAKATALRVTLNLDGTPISSNSHTYNVTTWLVVMYRDHGYVFIRCFVVLGVIMSLLMGICVVIRGLVREG